MTAPRTGERMRKRELPQFACEMQREQVNVRFAAEQKSGNAENDRKHERAAACPIDSSFLCECYERSANIICKKAPPFGQPRVALVDVRAIRPARISSTIGA